MRLDGHTILITGGTSGIGLALAECFLAYGNELIIVGRDSSKLDNLRGQYPAIVVYQCDISRNDEREKLVAIIREKHPKLNILINNAGIQNQYSFPEGAATEARIREEIETNLLAPLDLCAKLLPVLQQHPEAAVINISSGLGLVPKRSAPVYCGTKAGLHIFSKALRYQLEHSSVKVFEIIPPLVDTAMTAGHGRNCNKISPERLADEFMRSFIGDKYEVPIGKIRLLQWMQRFLPYVAEQIMKNN